MGQRANYIVIENSTLSIYHTHWRAINIAADLYLGEKAFIKYVKDCRPVDVLLNEPWIEGCVIIDADKKQLYFWSLEFDLSSVTDYYLKELQNKWRKWSVNLLYNRMYDVEQILGINYIAVQEKNSFKVTTEDELISDTLSEFSNRVIVVRNADKTHITMLGDAWVSSILIFGEPVVNILVNKDEYSLPAEVNNEVVETLVIDVVDKRIFFDSSELGLWDECKDKWPGYSFKMGDYGYIGALQLAGINVDEIRMNTESINIKFDEMVKYRDGFDPIKFADALLQEDKSLKFNQYFFDNIKPRPNLIRRLGNAVGKLLGVVK